LTEKEFEKKFEEEKSLYSLWGNYLLDTIRSKLKDIDFQVEPKVRVKDRVSLIAKAYYRNKAYENPYEDITDKVGIRFVLLLSSEIKKIDDIIQNKLNNCEFSKDRDFEQERLDEPLAFDYQSMHYILTSKSDFLYKDVMIPKGTTCEVQVRTLLQHAYSELSHSRVYKPSFDPDAKVKRIVAKSMALLETTDDYFEEVNNKMNEISAFNSLNKLTELLKETISQKIIVSYKSNYFIMDAFSDEFNNNSFSLGDYSKLKDVVKTNFNKTFLNSQPIIFFIYFMILNKKALLQDKWPLTTEELRPLFTQLGVSLNDLG
jgi:putative GTP pyrophosphokinase